MSPRQDNTYTPPTLPSHINHPLKAINGAPSDDEVKQVQVALRAPENLANCRCSLDGVILLGANLPAQFL